MASFHPGAWGNELRLEVEMGVVMATSSKHFPMMDGWKHGEGRRSTSKGLRAPVDSILYVESRILLLLQC